MLDNMHRALKPDGKAALLEYRLEDASGDHEKVSLRVRRSTDSDLLLTLPAGTLFEAIGEHRDMVTVRDAFVLLDRDREDFEVRAAGTRWNRPEPGRDDRFELRPAVNNGSLTRVARAVQAGTYRAAAECGDVQPAPPAESVASEETLTWPRFARVRRRAALVVPRGRRPARAATCTSSSWSYSTKCTQRPQYLQLVVSAPGGAVSRMRSRIRGANIWM